MADPLTRQNALEIVRQAYAAGQISTSHPYFRKRLKERGYSIRDAYRVVNVGKASKPAWREEHGNFEVRYEGRTVDRRGTRVVVAITESGTAYLINIIPLKGSRWEGR